ncbi:peptidase M19 [Urechidicola croceus]|uniref:Peptidase M19 n=1 Tax=Urechidicola croceus TaxID=1850246 RepID=A0A1D8PBM6_9FLAO|nr:peptidase M19 [Urechidicola croceus]
MKSRNDYIDFHCHPALKPYGKSYNFKPVRDNSTHRNRSRSIWRYNPPSLGDKLVNFLTGITKFSQSNFTSLANGGVSVICASLYPIEKPFFRNKIKNEFLKDIASNFATGVGRKRVDYIQGINNYFEDLEYEYDFYKQLDGHEVLLPEGKFRYKIVNSFAEIEEIKKKEEIENNKLTTICVVLSIEGMHVLNSDLKKSPDETKFLNNLNAIKSWQHSPFFVTIAHHFWNYLCGHSESFSGIVKKKADQSEGMGLGITSLGKKVIKSLLNTTNGKRILIDIKHMSPQSRSEYYKILDTTPEYANIPIIVSHGAANGLKSFDDRTVGNFSMSKKLNPVEINFYDEEIIRIAKSGGIIGLQLDERRIANEQTIKNTKHSLKRSKIMHYRSELLWNQVQHILQVLDDKKMFAWDCIALGTDFDGIIDPLNSFWTSEELPFLADYLERHAYNHMRNTGFKNAQNNIDADEIIDRIFSSNGMNFFKKHFV